jgi:lysozyme
MREGAVLRYYNDVANNCTFGIGTLAHFGRCTDDELRRPVTLADIHAQLATGVRAAEGAVKSHVKDHELTQDQFDALVSYTYNTGASGARQRVPGLVNRRREEAVPFLMQGQQ